MQMHTTEPEIDAVERDKISFASSDKLAELGHLKGGFSSHLRCEWLLYLFATLLAVYRQQRLSCGAEPFQCEPKLRVA